MEKKDQRNTIIIVIILLLLFFVFNKKEKKSENGEVLPPPPPPDNGNGNGNGNGNTDVFGCTDPLDLNYNNLATIDDGSCIGVGTTFPVECTGYNCSNFNWQTSCFGSAGCTPTTIAPTPLPIVEANNSNYLVGGDPLLKGDYKLYYICCPMPITNNGNSAGNQLPNRFSNYDYNNLNNKKWAILIWQPYQDALHSGGNATYTFLTTGDTWSVSHSPRNIINGTTYNNVIDWLGYNEAGISAEIVQRKYSWISYMTMRNRVHAYNNYMNFENPSVVIDGTDLYNTPCGTYGSAVSNASGWNNCAMDNAGTFIGSYADGTTRVIKADPFGVAFPLSSAYDPYTQTGNSPLESISATFNYQPYWQDLATDPEYHNIQTYTKLFNIT